MLKRFLPVRQDFFKLFEKAAEVLVLAAEEFHTLLLDLDHRQKHVDAIETLEQEADNIAHIIFGLLHKTFITPFDRHDIHQLTTKLDDTLDLINRCAQRFSFYELKKIPPQLIALAEISVQCAQLLKEAICRLHSLKNSTKILEYCEKLNALESQAHQLVLVGEKDLFLNESDFKNFFKLNEVYSWTKNATSSCQDVANIIKGIVLEYS